MTSATITLDDAQVRAALTCLAQRLDDPTPAMKDIGELWGVPYHPEAIDPTRPPSGGQSHARSDPP